MAKTCIKCGSPYEGRFCAACKKAIGKAYYARNKDKINSQSIAWRKANPEAVKAIRRSDYERNRDKRLAATAAWRAANPEKVNAYRVAYVAANKASVRERNAAWHEKNPLARRLHESNRRSRSTGKLSSDLPEKLFRLQRGKCACCKKSLGKDYHLDHVVPLALGGANVDSNMQLLRSVCNMQKHAKHPVDFMQQRGFLL